MQIIVRSARDHEPERKLARGLRGGANAVGGVRDVEDRIVGVPRCVFDRASDQPGRCAQTNGFSDRRGVTIGMLEPTGTYGGAYAQVSKGQVAGSVAASPGRKQSPNGQAPVSRQRMRSLNPSGRTKSESSSSGLLERNTSKNAFWNTAQALAVP